MSPADVGGFALALIAVLLVIFVLISARTFLRSWSYRETLKNESFGGAAFDRAAGEMATGDLLFFTAAAHPFHNSWVNKTLFTHVGVVVRGEDLPDTYGAGVYVSECAEGVQLADPSGSQRSFPGGSYLVPLGPRVHAYNGLVYWVPRTPDARLTQKERADVAQKAIDRSGRPYPGRWAMIFGALVGWSVSPHHQCYQHAGHVLNAADVKNAWTTDFFRSPAAMDAAARGDDPRYERAVVVHRLDDLERGKKTSGHHVRFCQI